MNLSKSVNRHYQIARAMSNITGGVAVAGVSVGGKSKSKKVRAGKSGCISNPWIAFLKKFRKDHPELKHYKASEVAIMASKAYNK